MNLRKIKALKKKVDNKAERMLKKLYKEYNNEMISLIKKEMPKGTKLISGNGCTWLYDKDDNEIHHGTAWSMYTGNHRQLEYIAGLQYGEEFSAGFLINQEIIKK